MSTQTSTAIAISSRTVSKTRSIKGIWWFVLAVSVIYSLLGTRETMIASGPLVGKTVYGILNFSSFVIGATAASIIFHRRPNDRLAIMVSLLLITWTSTDHGAVFWKLTGIGGTDWNDLFQYFFSLPYTILMSLLLLRVLLTFPDGEWFPPWTRWVFTLTLISQFLYPLYIFVIIGTSVVMILINPSGSDAENFITTFLDIIPKLFVFGILILGACTQSYRLLQTRNPTQRQQIKWIALNLVGMTIFYILYNGVSTLLKLDGTSLTMILLFLFLLFFTYGFIITILISILRYRLWDMELVFNKALVYSSLTAILGAVSFAGAILLDFFAKDLLTNSPLVGALVLLPVAALFQPVRDGLQTFVDRYFKPEEVDFSGTIVEFNSEAQLLLSPQDILKILVKQAREQLGVADAAIYLKQEDGNLLISEPLPLNKEMSHLPIDDKVRGQLEKGMLVSPSESSSFSLFIPLVINRASRPDFLGVLALGPRKSGTGYSTAVLKSLKKLGSEAGKAIYISQLRECLGQNIMDRLAAIERVLSGGHKSIQV